MVNADDKVKQAKGKSGPIDEFVDNLISEKGIKVSSLEVKEQLKMDLAARIEKNINRRLLEQMSGDDLATFEEMIDNDVDPTKIHEFIREKVPNSESVVAGALLEIRQLYLK